MNPSLYDLLNVDESATTDEIRASWKAAIADLDPTDRRFRAYNQAAETLLDPERRREYDAELAAAEPAESEPVAGRGTGAGARSRSRSPSRSRSRRRRPLLAPHPCGC